MNIKHLIIIKEDIELAFVFYDLSIKEKKLLSKLLNDIKELIDYEKKNNDNISFNN